MAGKEHAKPTAGGAGRRPHHRPVMAAPPWPRPGPAAPHQGPPRCRRCRVWAAPFGEAMARPGRSRIPFALFVHDQLPEARVADAVPFCSRAREVRAGAGGAVPGGWLGGLAAARRHFGWRPWVASGGCAGLPSARGGPASCGHPGGLLFVASPHSGVLRLPLTGCL